VLGRLAAGTTSDALLARAEYEGGPEGLAVLKSVLQQGARDPKLQDAVAREAAAYARLSHPAVVKLHEVFTEGARLMMSFEYVDGAPLSEVLTQLYRQNQRLGDEAAIYLAWRVTSGLAAAHAAKDPASGEPAPIIHRNLNPANVLLPLDGEVKIADFGIAKFAGMYGTQVMLSHTGYQAPEQVSAKPVTVRSDTYAACLILWELLAGRKAIVVGGGTPYETIMALANPQFPPLATLRPELPKGLLDAIAVGLVPQADQRTIGAQDLCDVLRASVDLDKGRRQLVERLETLRQPGAAVTSVPPSSSPDAPPGGRPPTPVPATAPPAKAKGKTPAWLAPLLVLLPLVVLAGITVAVKLGIGANARSLAVAPAAGSSDVGTITVAPESAGRPVSIDDRPVGDSPGSWEVRCGEHSVRIGSEGPARRVSVPCGGDVALR
jgi:serine/threonine-protein kinase